MSTKIPTLYTDYQEVVVDLNIYGKIISTPQQSLDAMRQSMYEEFRVQKPMPTMEQTRYELSRQVSEEYLIKYNEELNLQFGESLVSFSSGNIIENPDFRDLTPLIPEVQQVFAYEQRVNDSIREELIQKYSIETGEDLNFDVHQTEMKQGTVKEDESLIVSDDEIERLRKLVYGDYENEPKQEPEIEVNEGVSLDNYNSETEVTEDEDSNYSDFDEENDYDEEESDSEDMDYDEDADYDDDDIDYDEDYDSDDEDVDYESEDSDDDEYEDFGEDEDSDEEYEDFGEDEDEDSYEEELDEDSDSYEDDDEYEDFDEDEEDFDEDEEDYDEGETDEEEDYSEDDVDEEEYDDTESMEESISETLNNITSTDDDISFIEDEPVQVVTEKPKAVPVANKVTSFSLDDDDNIFGEVEESPVSSATVEEFAKSLGGTVQASSQNVFDMGIEDALSYLQEDHKEAEVAKEPAVDERPTDLRDFLRKHPRCTETEVLKYFSKKELQRNKMMGKIVIKNGIVRLS